ncbi:MAG: Cof-type HAD-IIB family hydrolase [Huintestinicola sp.]|uniref:Cof-type HAD-IIB family hydrolase n=1 Tax=Huintestinicola sp. TaxID=2981661 RepID=UPI003F03BDCB
MFKDRSKIILFSDMDGTLLNADKTLSEENLKAILRLREAGGKFVVATGRVLQATRHYFAPVGVDFPVILCNGGMIYDCGNNKVMWSEYLPEEKARAMIAKLLKKFPEACAEICTPDGIYDVQMNDYERRHWKIGGFTAEIMDSLESVPSGNWCKVLFAMPEESIKPFEEYAKSLEYAEDVEYITSSTIFHEMLPKNCSKGSAMKKLLELYGEADSVTAAIGDFNNDLEMLRNADFSACPSNAIDEVKAACNMVCKSDCSHGAVAELIEYILNS